MRDAALCVESVNCALCRVGQQKQIAPSQIGGEFGDRFFESKWDWGRLGPKRPDFVTVVDRSWFGRAGGTSFPSAKHIIVFGALQAK